MAVCFRMETAGLLVNKVLLIVKITQLNLNAICETVVRRCPIDFAWLNEQVAYRFGSLSGIPFISCWLC